jgi:hypothetical protein
VARARWLMTWSLALLGLLSPPAAPAAAAGAQYSDVRGTPYSVTLSPRGVAINGTPTLLLSGDIHYARAEPDMQERVLAMLRADGLNTVQTYAFWSVHESQPSTYDFGSFPRANVTAFLQRAADAGLFVSMRIGPFICGEWSYGGIPAWINPILDAGNGNIRAVGPWEGRMTSFVRRFFAEIEPFLAKNGGPIVLLQLENEDGPADPKIPYVAYVAELAESLNASLPFLWCGVSCAHSGCDPMRQLPGLVPAYNGNDGADWAEQTESQAPRYPLMWTENEGWYHPWGSDPIDDGGVGTRLQTAGSDAPSLPPPPPPPSSSSSSSPTSSRGGGGGGGGGEGGAPAPAPAPSPTQHCDRDPREISFAVARWV